MRGLVVVVVVVLVCACTRPDSPPREPLPAPTRPAVALAPAPVPDAALAAPVDAAALPDAPTRAYKLDGEHVEIVALGFDGAHALYAAGTSFAKLTVGTKNVTPKPKTPRRYSFVARFDAQGELDRLVRLDVAGDVTAMAVAADGSLVLVGNLTESVGPGPIRHTRADAFVLALGPDGKQRWQQLLDAKTRDDRAFAWDVAVDADGGIIVAGAFAGTMRVGDRDVLSFPGRHVPSVDAFVVRYKADGAFDWISVDGGAEDDGATQIAWATTGELLVVGSIGRKAVFGATTLAGPGRSAIANPQHAFVAAYARDGSPRWAAQHGTSSETTPHALVARADGSLLLYGTESPDAPTADRHGEQFIAELDGRGTTRSRRDVTHAKHRVGGFAYGDRVLVMRGGATQLVVEEVDGAGERELAVLPIPEARSHTFARGADGRVAAAVQVGDFVERPLGGGRVSVSSENIDAVLMLAPAPSMFTAP